MLTTHRENYPRRTRHAGHCWRNRDELISDVLQWTLSHGRAKAGRPARSYIQQLCADIGCSPEDPPEAMDDRERWRERVMDIRADGATWWWWWLPMIKQHVTLGERKDLFGSSSSSNSVVVLDDHQWSWNGWGVVYWASTRPNMPFQRRRSCIFHWRRRAWLTIWDKVKSSGTVTDWCTGREWPVNCMTVISVRWQSNMPFERQRKWHISDGKSWGDIEWAIELLFYSVRQKSVSWRSDELETRCGRENCTQQSGPPGLQLSSPGEREGHNADGHKSRGQYIAVLFGLQLPLTHKPFKYSERYIFLNEVFARLYSLRQYVFCMYICIYARLLCGYTTVGFLKRIIICCKKDSSCDFSFRHI